MSWHALRGRQIIQESKKAWLVDFRHSQAWIPKSQSKIQDFSLCRLLVKGWLYKNLEASGKIDTSLDPIDNHNLVREYSVDPEIIVPMHGAWDKQIEAVKKLSGLRIGALFMKVRTGKTKPAIALCLNHIAKKRACRVLWLTPVSVIETARERWHCQAPEMKIASLNEASHFSPDVMIVGIETLSSCRQEKFDILKRYTDSSTALVIDESHLCKNAKAIRSRKIRAIAERCPIRYLATGTHLTRDIGDLWHQMALLDWRILGHRTYHAFQRAHMIMSEKYPGLIRDTVHIDKLTERAAPFVYEWHPDGGADTRRQNIIATMSNQQRDLYEEIKTAIANRLLDHTESQHDIYLLFTALQGVLTGHLSSKLMTSIFRGPRDSVAIETPKLNALLDALRSDQSPAVIFCSRRSDLDILSSGIPNAGIISGDIAPKERHRIIQEFRQGKFPQLLAMTACSRMGIDMFEINRAIFFSHTFDWAARCQAEARISHEMKKQVNLIEDVIIQGSIDERIQLSYARKINLVKKFNDLMRKSASHCASEILKL